MPFYLCFLFISLMACSVHAQQKPQEIIFTSSTRGYTEKIRITPDSVYIEKQARGENTEEKKPIDKTTWHSLLKSLDNVKLSEISTLPSPTEDRARDAALHSQISVVSNGQTYTSSTFDGKKAPKTLMPLMQTILAVSDQKENK